jgi:hypothetical protein
MTGALFQHSYCDGDGECGTRVDVDNCGELDIYQAIDCTLPAPTWAVADYETCYAADTLYRNPYPALWHSLGLGARRTYGLRGMCRRVRRIC